MVRRSFALAWLLAAPFPEIGFAFRFESRHPERSRRGSLCLHELEETVAQAKWHHPIALICHRLA